MTTIRRLWCAGAVAAAIVVGAAAGAQQPDPTPPQSPVKLVFIHHSTGENWLRDVSAGDDTAGGLGAALAQNNYFVSDTNYGWGPGGIGDRTDIGNWWEWFRGPDSAAATAALYAESGQNCSYTRLGTDPGGENEVVLFKSCFPNSNLGGSPSDPVPPIGQNPLRGEDSSSPYHAIGNAKGIYLDLLDYFATRPDRLFVVVCAPPLRQEDTGAQEAANARALNDWLVDHLLDGYPGRNVAVFDFYTVLTSNGGSASVNDLGASTGNHHRWRGGQVEHVKGLDNDYSSYPSGDSHPSSAGGQKASGEFPALLNIAYHCWKDTGGCVAGTCTVACSATVPTWAAVNTAVSFAGSATASSACTGGLAYDWDYSDGSAHSALASPTHTYAQTGTYTWTFTATSGTATCTKTGTLVVDVPSGCALDCSVTAPHLAQTDAAAAFSSAVTVTGCSDTPTLEWDFGDGSAHSSEQAPQHLYTAAGDYTWTLTARLHEVTCSETGSIAVVDPPVIGAVTKMPSPFRIKITGSHFLDGATVTLGGDADPWPNAQRKRDSQIVLKGGATLKARFPSGQAVTLTVRNPDGGTATGTYTRP